MLAVEFTPILKDVDGSLIICSSNACRIAFVSIMRIELPALINQIVIVVTITIEITILIARI